MDTKPSHKVRMNERLPASSINIIQKKENSSISLLSSDFMTTNRSAVHTMSIICKWLAIPRDGACRVFPLEIATSTHQPRSNLVAIHLADETNSLHTMGNSPFIE